MAAKKKIARKSASSYEIDIANQRIKVGVAKDRLEKAEEKEIRRYLKIAKSVGVMHYPITNEEIREVFAELKEKKLSLDENQQYSRNGND